MKMNKKKVFTLALAVCLIAILSMSTLAWFNDSDTIVNEFMTSDSNGNGTDACTVSTRAKPIPASSALRIPKGNEWRVEREEFAQLHRNDQLKMTASEVSLAAISFLNKVYA